MADETDLPKVIDTLGRAFEEFKSANDANIKKRDGVTEEKLARLDAALNAATEAKAALELRLAEVEKKAGRPQFGGAEDDKALAAEVKAFNHMAASMAQLKGRPAPAALDTKGYAEYKQAFGGFIRAGDHALSYEERKAMSVGSDPDGGYTVHADMTGKIVTRVFETSPIRQIASVVSISTDALEGVVDRDEAGGMVMVNETGMPGETSTPQIGKWRIEVHEGAVEPKVTQRLLDDTSVDVEGWLARKVADKIARGQNNYFVNGTGKGQPYGFAKYPTAATADATRAWGTLQHVGTGVNGDFAASAPADVLFDLVGSFKDFYLQNARFVTRREMITKVRKFKGATTGDYLWQPGLQAGKPDMLIGYPITIAQDMPAIATGSLSLAFGNFSEGYQIVDRQGIRVMRDALTLKPYVKFWTTVRFGGAVLDFEAIKFLKLA